MCTHEHIDVPNKEWTKAKLKIYLKMNNLITLAKLRTHAQYVLLVLKVNISFNQCSHVPMYKNKKANYLWVVGQRIQHYTYIGG